MQWFILKMVVFGDVLEFMTSCNRLKTTYVDFVAKISWFVQLPWLCFGDFNEILQLNEKIGKNDGRVSVINEFREVVKFCGLRDLGCKGHPSTWYNRRFGPYLV